MNFLIKKNTDFPFNLMYRKQFTYLLNKKKQNTFLNIRDFHYIFTVKFNMIEPKNQLTNPKYPKLEIIQNFKFQISNLPESINVKSRK